MSGIAIDVLAEETTLDGFRTLVKEQYSEERRETRYKISKLLLSDEKLTVDDIDFDDELLKKLVQICLI